MIEFNDPVSKTINNTLADYNLAIPIPQSESNKKSPLKQPPKQDVFEKTQ